MFAVSTTADISLSMDEGRVIAAPAAATVFTMAVDEAPIWVQLETSAANVEAAVCATAQDQADPETMTTSLIP